LAERDLHTNAKETKNREPPNPCHQNPQQLQKLLLKNGFYTAGQLHRPITTFVSDPGESRTEKSACSGQPIRPDSKTWLGVQTVNKLFTTLSIILAFAFACDTIVIVTLLFKKKSARERRNFSGAAQRRKKQGRKLV